MILSAPALETSAAQPLIALLEQLASVVSQLTDGQYTQKPVGVIESSVGGHVRHCLDHVRALLEAIETRELNYDLRCRGTSVESSVLAAREVTDQLVRQLRARDNDPDLLEQPLRVMVLLAADGPAVVVSSSVGRELAYVLAHTVHHNALIGAMVKTLGGRLPDRFGYAPSTIKHMEARSCAR